MANGKKNGNGHTNGHAAVVERDPLNLRQRAFLKHYLSGPPGVRGNGAQSALLAGYSEKAAREQASELLTYPHIKAAVDRHVARLNITTERVLSEIAKIAFADMREIASWGPHGVTFKPSEDLDEAASAAIAEVSETVTEAGTSVRVKLHDKLGALRDLAKVLKIVDPEREAASVTNIFTQINISNPERMSEDDLDRLDALLSKALVAGR